MLVAGAWAVHLYTASGAMFGLFAIDRAVHGDFRGSFLAMAAATAIDSTDGTLARAVHIHDRVPQIDGALLDNIVDYLTFVVAPVYLIVRAEIIPAGAPGTALAALVLLMSALGFCHTEAKTEDHYFRGFPSYWNLVALYLYCFGLSPWTNFAIIAALALMVLVPIKCIYPSRTVPMRSLTLTLGAIWAVATVAMLPQLPRPSPFLLAISFAYVLYYFGVSFILQARNALNEPASPLARRIAARWRRA